MTEDSFFGCADAADDAAFGLGRRNAHRLAGQDFIDGNRQVAPLELRLGESDAGAERVLIVDPPLIANHALPVDDEGLGRAGRPEFVGDPIAQVLEDRKRQTLLPREGIHLDDRVLAVRVDAEECDPFDLEFLRECLHPRPIQLRQGALGSQEDDGHRFFLAEQSRQRMLFPAVVFQSEGRDLRPTDGSEPDAGADSKKVAATNEPSAIPRSVTQRCLRIEDPFSPDEPYDEGQL